MLAVLVVAALLTVPSETIYWYSGGTDYPFRVLVYLIPATAMLRAMATRPPRGWPALIICAAVYGFVTEGVLTPIVYGGFPFDPFAIAYPSLGWHALVSVVVGLVVMHRQLVHGAAHRALAVTAALGVFWGIWAASLRLPPEADVEPASLDALVGRVSVGVFALYAVLATAVFAVCHLMLGRYVTQDDLVPRRWWWWTMLAIGAGWFAVLVVPAAPWAPIELTVLLWVCHWALRHTAAPAARNAPAWSFCEPVPLRRIGLLAALPAAATTTYALVVVANPSERILRIVTRDIPVGVQAIAGGGLFAWALWSARTASHSRQVAV